MSPSTPNTMATPMLELDPTAQRLAALGLYGLQATLPDTLHEPWLARVIEIEETERARRSL
jgi:hypothetical protein